MKGLESLRTAAVLKSLREQGLTNRDIMGLAKEGEVADLAKLAGKE